MTHRQWPALGLIGFYLGLPTVPLPDTDLRETALKIGKRHRLPGLLLIGRLICFKLGYSRLLKMPQVGENLPMVIRVNAPVKSLSSLGGAI